MSDQDTAKYHFLGPNGRTIRSGITSQELEDRERQLRRETGINGTIEQVGRRTTREAARDWEDEQSRGTPPGG